MYTFEHIKLTDKTFMVQINSPKFYDLGDVKFMEESILELGTLTEHEKEPIIFLDTLWVEEKHRNKGVCTALLNHVFNSNLLSKYKYCYLIAQPLDNLTDQNTLVDLYSKNGFIDCGIFNRGVIMFKQLNT